MHNINIHNNIWRVKKGNTTQKCDRNDTLQHFLGKKQGYQKHNTSKKHFIAFFFM